MAAMYELGKNTFSENTGQGGQKWAPIPLGLAVGQTQPTWPFFCDCPKSEPPEAPLGTGRNPVLMLICRRGMLLLGQYFFFCFVCPQHHFGQANSQKPLGNLAQASCTLSCLETLPQRGSLKTMKPAHFCLVSWPIFTLGKGFCYDIRVPQFFFSFFHLKWLVICALLQKTYISSFSPQITRWSGRGWCFPPGPCPSHILLSKYFVPVSLVTHHLCSLCEIMESKWCHLCQLLTKNIINRRIVKEGISCMGAWLWELSWYTLTKPQPCTKTNTISHKNISMRAPTQQLPVHPWADGHPCYWSL